MDYVSREELRSLAERNEEPSVSIYLPRHPSVAEAGQDPIHLRNLLDRAETQLVERGVRRPVARDLLQPAREMEKDPTYWRPGSVEGVAVLIAPGFFRSFQLPHSCPELAVVGNEFHLAPLMHGLSRDDRFYLLALSPKSVRLFHYKHSELTAVALPEGMPTSIDEALAGTEIEKSLQFHTSSAVGPGGNWAGIMHGHGSPKDDEKTLVQEYFRILAKHLEPFLNTREHLPMVLAAVDYCHPMFHDACHYPRLLKEGVQGSPDKMSEQELLDRALPIVEPWFRRRVQEAAARYERLISTERTSHELEAVVPAAHHGRVDILFAPLGVQVWGQFDAANEDGWVTQHEEPQSDDVDLVDFAVKQTLIHRGDVYVIPSSEMPQDGAVAALFRW